MHVAREQLDVDDSRSSQLRKRGLYIGSQDSSSRRWMDPRDTAWTFMDLNLMFVCGG